MAVTPTIVARWTSQASVAFDVSHKHVKIHKSSEWCAWNQTKILSRLESSEKPEPPWEFRVIPAQLRSGYCSRLNSYLYCTSWTPTHATNSMPAMHPLTTETPLCKPLKTTHLTLLPLWSELFETASFLNLPLDDHDDLDSSCLLPSEVSKRLQQQQKPHSTT